MDRVDQLREARNSPHVSFTEYIKLRAKTGGAVLVFEGKQCPALYIGWLHQLLRACADIGGQIIARGKKNVLALRDLILRNPQTATDRNLYFVDRDYDVEPKQGSFWDVYVTRGYSIENELVGWPVLGAFLRAYFDIADSEDHEALQFSEQHFQDLFSAYLVEARELHRIVYICRTRGIDCYPGETALSYVQVDWSAGTVRRSYDSVDALLVLLKVDRGAWPTVTGALRSADDFDGLDPLLDWRGKFHFSIVRGFLMFLREARASGAPPFKRAARLNVDPSHPSLMGVLGSLSARPPCLTSFVEQFVRLAATQSAAS